MVKELTEIAKSGGHQLTGKATYSSLVYHDKETKPERKRIKIITEDGEECYLTIERKKYNVFGDNTKRYMNGEIWHENDYVAAHRTLPYGTIVKVINLKNNKSVKVKIVGRGPYGPGRIIDLSQLRLKTLEWFMRVL